MSVASRPGSEAPKARARETPVVRVGYVEARPWSYRADAGPIGSDADAIRFVADALGARVEFICRPASELRSGLLAGDYDIAIGGLAQQVYDDIDCIAVSRPRNALSANDMRSRCRQAFFPDIWWVRRGQRLWRLRLRLILLAWKYDIRVLSGILRWVAQLLPALAGQKSGV